MTKKIASKRREKAEERPENIEDLLTAIASSMPKIDVTRSDRPLSSFNFGTGADDQKMLDEIGYRLRANAPAELKIWLRKVLVAGFRGFDLKMDEYASSRASKQKK